MKGRNFDKFVSDWNNGGSYHHEPSSNNRDMQVVSSDMIEGIEVDEDMNNFWNMHNSSKEFWSETASHVPEVQKELSSGRSLEDLYNDPELGTCTSLFFNPENAIRVEKREGYFAFDGDGRHRVLIARELGLNIPIRVVGTGIFK